MKLLYLHGLDSKPNMAKIAILESDGHEVVAPHIDYRKHINDIELFISLEKLCIDEKVETIVGSSLGGYMGFFLSEKLMIPAVLFNPALGIRSIEIPVIQKDTDTEKSIIIGKFDEVIEPENTKVWLNHNDYKNIILKEIDAAHQITIEQFKTVLEFI